MPDNINFSRKALVNYDHDPTARCWYDECNCEPVPIADCDALIKENNEGVGRFACRIQNENCFNKKFFTSFIKKLACQFEHVIQNICGLWDIVECMREYLKQLGDMGTIHYVYTRNSSISSADFLHPATDSYTLDLYMDSTTGVVEGESDDQRRKATDRKYRAFVRWCADATSMDENVGNLTQFTVFHSGETFTDDMLNQRGLHFNIIGAKESSQEHCDSIIMPAGTYLRIRVTSDPENSGKFRVHNFRVEYTPVIDDPELPECLQDEPDPNAKNEPSGEPTNNQADNKPISNGTTTTTGSGHQRPNIPTPNPINPGGNTGGGGTNTGGGTGTGTGGNTSNPGGSTPSPTPNPSPTPTGGEKELYRINPYAFRYEPNRLKNKHGYKYEKVRFSGTREVKVKLTPQQVATYRENQARVQGGDPDLMRRYIPYTGYVPNNDAMARIFTAHVNNLRAVNGISDRVTLTPQGNDYARKRVEEMLENQVLSHDTKYDVSQRMYENCGQREIAFSNVEMWNSDEEFAYDRLLAYYSDYFNASPGYGHRYGVMSGDAMYDGYYAKHVPGQHNNLFYDCMVGIGRKPNQFPRPNFKETLRGDEMIVTINGKESVFIENITFVYVYDDDGQS